MSNDAKQGLTRLVTDNGATWEEIHNRLRRHDYKPSLIRFMWAVEEAWEEEWLDNPDEFDESTFVRLHRLLEYTVESKAARWERWFGRNGYTHDDFASVMWEKIWKLCSTYNQAKADYLLFETIRRSLDNAVRDYLRKESRLRKREAAAWERWKMQRKTVNELNDDWEEHATNRLLVTQILRDDVLTDEERAVLQAVYENPDESMRCISEILGQNPMKTHRMMERIRSKLSDVYGDVLMT